VNDTTDHPTDQSTGHPTDHGSGDAGDDRGRKRRVFRFLNKAWDVTSAHDLVEDGAGSQVRLLVADWARLLGVITADPAHAETADLDQPLIVVQIPDCEGPRASPVVGPMIIDGWQRVYRASSTGREYLPAVLLDAEHEARIRLTPTIRLVTD
jgi:hypothetical protein